jgi:hypothetical protein
MNMNNKSCAKPRRRSSWAGSDTLVSKVSTPWNGSTSRHGVDYASNGYRNEWRCVIGLATVNHDLSS